MSIIKNIINKAKDARWSLYQKLETDVHELRYLFWETTRVCNLNCLHCGSDCGRDNAVHGLPADVMLDLFKKISDKFDASKIMLVLTGGEPLVRKDLFEILSKTKEMGFKLGMVTNGYTLDQKKAQRIRQVGITSIVVSLDGPENEHNWLRNREDSYEKAINALRYLSDVGIPIVEAITCVTPRTVDKLEETYEIVKSTGARYWRIFNIFPIGRAKDNKDVLISPEQFRKVVSTLGEIRKRAKTENMVVNLSEEGFLGWDFESLVRDTPYFCRAGVNIAGIMADGTISACPNLPEWMGQGNILTDDFVSVWENRYDIFRDRKWMSTGECAECPQLGVCNGNSLHVWDEDKNGPVWCHHKILNDKDQ
jgi:radical SAM protein with 4Fe4S-binding SPASM domain